MSCFFLGWLAGAYSVGFGLTLAGTLLSREPWPERIVIPLFWFVAVPMNLCKG